MGKPAEFVAPPDYVFTARTAVLVEGRAKVGLWVETEDVVGDQVKRCLGFLDTPYSRNAQLVRGQPRGRLPRD